MPDPNLREPRSTNGGNEAELQFTWDPAKAAANLAKHGVAFAQAATVFADVLALTVFDEAHSDFEERWFTLGMDAQGKLIAVSHTYGAIEADGAMIRIISAREATRAERRQYEDEIR